MSTRSKKLDEARRKALKALSEMSDEEDAAITADAEADPDNPPADALISRAGRIGRPPLEKRKQAVKLRLDPEVIERFKAGGPGWQTRINQALRKVVGLQ